MLIGITGTPGTGKTSVAEALRRRGIDVLDLKTTVAPYVLEHDEEMGADIIDVEEWAKANRFLEGYAEGAIAHYLPAEKIIILRCRPDVLKERLAPRGYPAEKIRENAEAEALDVILIEAADAFAAEQIYEIDTTSIDSETAAELIISFAEGKIPASFGSLDWSEYVMSL
ncbi:MAG: dephospho-CoA kinase [Methanocorpusculum parvum]|nr:dephospho-CoA kinase [Methanocorpusculum parvum]